VSSISSDHGGPSDEVAPGEPAADELVDHMLGDWAAAAPEIVDPLVVDVHVGSLSGNARCYIATK
jgi:hypothetical protein